MLFFNEMLSAKIRSITIYHQITSISVINSTGVVSQII